MKDKIIYLVTALILVVFLSYLLDWPQDHFRPKSSDVTKPSQSQRSSSSSNSRESNISANSGTNTSSEPESFNAPLVPSLHVATRTDIDNSNYDIQQYPMYRSPFFKTAADCVSTLLYDKSYTSYLISDYLPSLSDFMLLSKSGEVIIPSLRGFTASKLDSCSGAELFIYSKPRHDSHIFLGSYHISNGGMFNPGLDNLYDLDLSDLSLAPLDVTRVLVNDDLMGDSASSTKYILSDGITVIKWTYRNIYKVNLREDTSKVIFTAPAGTWLASSAAPDFGRNGLKYRINVTDNTLTASLFEMRDESGSPIIIDEFGNISADFGPQGVKSKFYKDITIRL